MLKPTGEEIHIEACDLCGEPGDFLSFTNDEKPPILVHRDCLKKLVQDTVNLKA